MAGNTFGTILRLTTFGESHGIAIGGILDGFPPGVPIRMEDVRKEMALRRPGSKPGITTERDEKDEVKFLSGLSPDFISTGTPIGFIILNSDSRSSDYENLEKIFRPGHADYTYQKKYGIREHRGGGRSSARETACRVAAGAIARQLLKKFNIEITAYVSSVGPITLPADFNEPLDNTLNMVRCPDADTAEKMIRFIRDVKAEGDSVGGTITCVVKGCPAGWGEPVFDKIHADLGKAILSINACKGFEIGSGFLSAKMKGSEHNDPFYPDSESKIRTRTNHSGGVLGGITNGEDIYFRAAFKPPSTISKKQETINFEGESVQLEATGRHDPCIVPRAVAVVEAMTALVLADHYLRQKTTIQE